MLKIIHLFTGAAALLVSLILASKNSEVAPLLTSFALANLLIAPILPIWARGRRRQLQGIVSALIVFATVIQMIFSFSNSKSSLGLIILFVAVAIHLALNLRKVVSTISTKSVPLSQDLSDRETGTVKWFNTSKGFGFISRDSGDDIFVHFRAIRGEGHRVLVEGQRVEFTVMDRDKGLQAEDVIAALPDERD